MEEDINILENGLKATKKNRRGNQEIRFEVNSNYYKVLENLIARYKELEEENKKMKANNLLKLNKEINENIQVAYGGRRYNTEGIVIENYIPKSKVQEKIEELKKYGNNLTEEQRQKETEFLQGKLKAYEELLED